jgi:RNA polymerase sigma factor (sigma-70 family)
VVRSHDIDDLCQAGAIGLMEAAERFDTSRGVKFHTFAQRRIIGAVIDYQRTLLGRAGRKQKVRPLLATDLTRDGNDDDDERPMERIAGVAHSIEGQIDRVRGAVVARLSRTLPARTAQMAVMHFFDRKTMRVVGEAFGVSEQRVCQILRPVEHTVMAAIESEVAREAAGSGA